MALGATIHSQKKYGKGHVLFLTVYDGKPDKHVLANQTVKVGKVFLASKELDDFIAAYLIRVEDMLTNPPVQEETLLRFDVEQILKDKGYLAEGQVFEDLPAKEVSK